MWASSGLSTGRSQLRTCTPAAATLSLHLSNRHTDCGAGLGSLGSCVGIIFESAIRGIFGARYVVSGSILLGLDNRMGKDSCLIFTVEDEVLHTVYSV